MHCGSHVPTIKHSPHILKTSQFLNYFLKIILVVSNEDLGKHQNEAETAGRQNQRKTELRDQIIESLSPAPNGSSLLFTKLNMREGFITSSKKDRTGTHADGFSVTEEDNNEHVDQDYFIHTRGKNETLNTHT